MDRIYGWIKTVSTLLIVVSLIKNLLPGKSYNSYFNAFLGMLVVYIICRPLSGDYSLEDIISNMSYVLDESALYSDEKLDDLAYALTAAEYEKILCTQIKNEAELAGLEVSDVEVVVEDEEGGYGLVTDVTVFCSSYCTEEEVDAFCVRLSDLLGIDVGCIACKI